MVRPQNYSDFKEFTLIKKAVTPEQDILEKSMTASLLLYSLLKWVHGGAASAHALTLNTCEKPMVKHQTVTTYLS